MKVVIVGGVAGGASCAARLRRLDENAEIIMVEKGPYVSYANCGLPYYVGGVIKKESSLLVASEMMFKVMFGIDARTSCEAVAVSAKDKTIELRNVETGEISIESYDKLVLSPGAASVHPPLPGIDLPGIFQVRTVPDAREIREWIDGGTSFLAGMAGYSGMQMVKPVRRAVVVGGGFIGLEMAENLVHIGFEVTVLQKLPQILGPLDPEFAVTVEEFVKARGVQLELNDGAAAFEQLDNGAINVKTNSGKDHAGGHCHSRHWREARIPRLPKQRNWKLAVVVAYASMIKMHTSDPDIFAVGDAIEVKDFGTGEWSLVALAGPANRQGRIAADVISGRDSRFRGTQGPSIIGLFGGAAAWTGVSEKMLAKAGRYGL